MKTIARFAALIVLAATSGAAPNAVAHPYGSNTYDYDAYAPITRQSAAPTWQRQAPGVDLESQSTATGGPVGGLPDKN